MIMDVLQELKRLQTMPDLLLWQVWLPVGNQTKLAAWRTAITIRPSFTIVQSALAQAEADGFLASEEASYLAGMRKYGKPAFPYSKLVARLVRAGYLALDEGYNFTGGKR